jgi:alpha-L-fucosidase 2
MKVECQLVLTLLFLLVQKLAFAAEPVSNLKIWFDNPASDWEREGLPIGNGAMVAAMGETDVEHLQFNEKTLWRGRAWFKARL